MITTIKKCQWTITIEETILDGKRFLEIDWKEDGSTSNGGKLLNLNEEKK